MNGSLATDAYTMSVTTISARTPRRCFGLRGGDAAGAGAVAFLRFCFAMDGPHSCATLREPIRSGLYAPLRTCYSSGFRLRVDAAATRLHAGHRRIAQTDGGARREGEDSDRDDRRHGRRPHRVA